MNRFRIDGATIPEEEGLFYFPETDQEEDMLGWINELDEDDKIMLHSLAIYMALGGKLNAFNVQETGVDINGV